MPQNDLYRAKSYVKHVLTAWNTRGENIHSPYLFYLVDKIIYDNNAYYAWATIDRLFHRRKNTRKEQLLFRLVQHLSHEAEQRIDIVEVGTTNGLSTAYLASANKHNRVYAYIHTPVSDSHPETIWKKLKLQNISSCQDPDNKILRRDKWKIDFAYVTNVHTYNDYLRYFNIIGARAHEKTILVLDDIHQDEDTERAWLQICRRPEVTTTMDLYHVGLVFFDTHYLKRNFKLRI